MKPIRLEMTAFGSYAEKTVVPFGDFPQGLFLISGKTGTGKTMIFDAIAFALFGKTSGSGRDPLRMHCDRVSLSEDTVVKLTFLQNDRKYTVERTIHFSRKRGTADQFNDGKQSAVLEEPDGTVTDGQDKVNTRCAELLGMNVDQFRKIVMLAQGEFREFLNADSDKKNEILGRLFDNRAFTRYQGLLNGARSLLEARRRDHQARLAELISEGFPEDSTPEEERLLYNPENPECLANLKKLVDADEERVSGLEKIKNEAAEKLRELNTERGAAEGVNREFDELKAKEAALEVLVSREAEMKRVQETAAVAAAVLHTVRPKIEARDRAKEALETAERDLERLGKSLEEAERKLAAAGQVTSGDAETVGQVRRLGNEIHSLTEQLPRYQELGRRLAERETAAKAEKAAREGREEAEKNRQALAGEQEAVAAQLEELKEIDHQTEALAEADGKARSACETLTGRNGIAETARSVQAEERRLAEEAGRLEKLALKASQAENVHHELYQRFIAGQAGLLADELRRNIAAEGRAVCPVCGVLHDRADEHFAAMPEGTPGEDAVRSAEKALRQAEDERKKQEARVQEERNALSGRKNDLLRKADPVFPGCTWEQLSADQFLKRAEGELKKQAGEAAAALEEARRKQAERDALVQKQAGNQRKIDQLAELAEARRQEEARQHAALAGAESAVDALKRTLAFASAEEAQAQIKRWTEQQTRLQSVIDGHAEAEKKAKQEHDNLRGSLDSRREEIPGLKKKLSAAQAEMEGVLGEHGFADEAAALGALEPIGNEREEAWLERQTRAVHDYDSDCRNTRSRIGELRLKTKGRKYTDLEELDGRIAEKQKEQNDAEAGYHTGNVTLETHRRILEKAASYRNALVSTDTAWLRLSRLATLAVGSNGEGGKLSFDRYVMGAVFREILEMANRRIDILSGGRYELVHRQDSDRKNAKAGLEIEVMDTAIGKARPSSLLSGGEGFYASLSLALGLSDTVQNHAGGKKLDALFIDEGFGTLSADVMDKALEVLNQLTAGQRLVGIISHMDKLDESIPQKLRVTCDEKGSHIHPELS